MKFYFLKKNRLINKNYYIMELIILSANKTSIKIYNSNLIFFNNNKTKKIKNKKNNYHNFQNNYFLLMLKNINLQMNLFHKFLKQQKGKMIATIIKYIN